MNVNRADLTLAAVVHNEIDPTALLEFECMKLHNNDDGYDINRVGLDQEFKIDDALYIQWLTWTCYRLNA